MRRLAGVLLAAAVLWGAGGPASAAKAPGPRRTPTASKSARFHPAPKSKAHPKKKTHPRRAPRKHPAAAPRASSVRRAATPPPAASASSAADAFAPAAFVPAEPEPSPTAWVRATATITRRPTRTATPAPTRTPTRTVSRTRTPTPTATRTPILWEESPTPERVNPYLPHGMIRRTWSDKKAPAHR